MGEVVPMLHTKNVARLRDFYESLGFTQQRAWMNQGVLTWMDLTFQGASVMLQLSSNAKDAVSSSDVSLYFVVDNVDGTYATFKRRGIRVTEPRTEFYGWRQIFVRDPDGRSVCFESVVGTD